MNEIKQEHIFLKCTLNGITMKFKTHFGAFVDWSFEVQ
jgi:hypothetical protein